jgi:hypothetical protein
MVYESEYFRSSYLKLLENRKSFNWQRKEKFSRLAEKQNKSWVAIFCETECQKKHSFHLDVDVAAEQNTFSIWQNRRNC